MTATLTGRLIGRLDVEGHRPDWIPDGETTSAPTFYWPRDTYLQNDGQMHQWMTEGTEDYEVRHDGVGWVVTRGTWPHDGHTYRLAAGPAREFIDWLPITGDLAVLDPAHRYAIRCTREAGGPVFDLYEIA